jgi:hypothetical protein
MVRIKFIRREHGADRSGYHGGNLQHSLARNNTWTSKIAASLIFIVHLRQLEQLRNNDRILAFPQHILEKLCRRL